MTGEDGYEAKDFAFIYNIHNRRLRLHVPGSIKIVDHPWLWHGVLTRMMVLEDRPRIVASLERLWRVDTRVKTSTGHCFHLQYKQ